MGEKSQKRSLGLILNAIIIILILMIAYFAYAFFSRTTVNPTSEAEAQRVKPEPVIQLDVLNGCGAKGVAAKFTKFLRTGGFDVVEVKNYKTFHVLHSLVVDRVGNLTSARRVAKALGVVDTNVIQQINPDYFVDVSVIIGEDYSHLKPLTQTSEEPY